MTKAKQLILKALDDIDLCEKILPYENQHDNTGYHMAQACEKLLKALCLIYEIDYPTTGFAGHDLRNLFSLLENYDFIQFREHMSLARLSIYSSHARYEYVDTDDRLNLPEYIEKLKSLRRQVLIEFQLRGAD